MRLRGGRWEMEVLPKRGGRIASLHLDGKELLDRGIGVDEPSAPGFVEAGAWGWDELVPTVEESRWGDVSLPDHGEAWRLPWAVEQATESAATMTCEGSVLPWRLQRRIVMGAAIRVEYAMRNIGSGHLPAYWCSHALFRYETDMTVEVGARLMSFAPGRSGKFFVARGTLDHASLAWRSGPGIGIAWDGNVAPYCGVWICNGDLGGYRQVAIEPATGGQDRPDSDEPPPVLAPGESIEWWLEIRHLDLAH